MYKWWQIKNTFIMVWYWLVAKVGYELSTDPIPENTYYNEKNLDADGNRNNDGTYHTKPCKYFTPLGSEYTGCAFLGIITDDMTFGDQCKMCGLKDDYNDED